MVTKLLGSLGLLKAQLLFFGSNMEEPLIFTVKEWKANLQPATDKGVSNAVFLIEIIDDEDEELDDEEEQDDEDEELDDEEEDDEDEELMTKTKAR
jgi:hypothetical protein